MAENYNTKRLVRMSFFTTLALMVSYIEALFPFSIGVPGIKLGLANLVILYVLYTVGAKEAFLVNITRILLSGLLFGSLSVILFSLSGGIISFIIMLLIKNCRIFSILSVSAMGGGVA